MRRKPKPFRLKKIMAESTRSEADAADCLTAAARFHDYRRASNPLRTGGVTPIPGMRFPAAIHEQGPTRIVPLDTSLSLGCPPPATTPGLCASFIHIKAGDTIVTDANATSQLFFVMRGAGTARLEDSGLELAWQTGDLFTLPATTAATHIATVDAALYWVHDGPLLTHLGVEAVSRRFAPTLYRHDAIRQALDAVLSDPESKRANRLSVLLGNHLFPEAMTATHVLWAMFGILPVGAIQAPHRHQSVAVDLVVDASPGCYTLVGKSLAADGSIKDPERFAWEPHSVFITPPGLWHSHHNESGQPAHVLPIQDAGLHTYLRTLSIVFSKQTSTGHEVVDDAG